MTQITEEQRQQIEGVADRVVGKLKAFHDSLAVDEQAVLGAALRRMTGTDEGTDDTAGYSTATLLGLAATRVIVLLTGLETFPPFQPRGASS